MAVIYQLIAITLLSTTTNTAVSRKSESDSFDHVGELGNETNNLKNSTIACNAPAHVYQTSGPVNIYLPEGIVPDASGTSFTTKDKTNHNCNCPMGPPGEQGPPGLQGLKGEPGEVIYKMANNSNTQFAAFSAVMEARPFGPYQYYKIVDFDNIITNVGGGYNDNRGTFTAPHSGFYQFHVHIHTITGHHAEVRLMLNSQRVISLWADGTIGQDQTEKPATPVTDKNKQTINKVHEMGSSNSIIIHMRQGEQIYCLLPKQQVLAGLGFSSFSGHLLHVD